MKESELRTALLISGGGTTAEAVVHAVKEGRLRGINPVAVIASKHNTQGELRAQSLGVPAYVVDRRDYATADAFGEQLLKIMRQVGVDLVSQNGWLVKTPVHVIEAVEGKVINQHPGPLDLGRHDFGGVGMYGRRVICARLAYEWVTADDSPWTEATTHWVTRDYDQGELIRVMRLGFEPFSRPITIAELKASPQQLLIATDLVQQALLPLEHENVIRTLELIAENEFIRLRRSEALVPEENKDCLEESKLLAVSLFPKG